MVTIMIKVNEILQLSLFKDFKQVCGGDYLDNTVSLAVILEYESISTGYVGFNYGDFVLASYFFARICPDIVNNALSVIIKRHVSGIAIKMEEEDTLPKEIIDLAEEYHVPVFTFSGQYMEDLILSISESLNTKDQYIILEEKLNSILNGNMDAHTVKTTALEINHNFLPFVITANITPKDENDNVAIHSYFKKLMYRQFRNTAVCTYSFVKYKYGIVLICSFDDENIPANGTHCGYISSILNSVEFNPDGFNIGICDTPLPLSSLGSSVLKAIDANIVCRFLKAGCINYTSLGIYKYIMTLVNNPIIYADIESHIKILKEYDNSFASNLLDTLVAYIKNNGDISKTATAIFQHTNTVRYRIKKACSLLSLSSEHSYEEMYLIINCYLLNGILNPAD